jgi:hypothetical protein
MPAKTKQTRRPKINEAAKMDEVAKKTGISISALRLHQRAGVNIYDDDELREHIQKTGNRTRSLNMEWLGVEPAPENADIQTLKDELTRTIDRNVAQRIKTQIDGLLSAQKLEVLNASYISMIDVKDAFTKLGSVIRAGIMRMQADLPPALEGQSPSRMAKIIGESSEKLLTELSETESELWQID